jgi:hypothetical protein
LPGHGDRLLSHLDCLLDVTIPQQRAIRSISQEYGSQPKVSIGASELGGADVDREGIGVGTRRK